MADLDASRMVVTATYTIMDGQVIRWYASVQAAAAGREVMSASRNGVLVRTFLHEIPDDALDAARKAQRDLAAGRDVGHLATVRDWREVRRALAAEAEADRG